MSPTCHRQQLTIVGSNRLDASGEFGLVRSRSAEPYGKLKMRLGAGGVFGTVRPAVGRAMASTRCD